jgi:hypothetical protein
MHFYNICRRYIIGAAVAGIFGTAFAGCAGGGNGAVPSAPPSQKMLAVDRAGAAAVMRKVSNSVAYYAPMKGHGPRLLDLRLRRPMTSAAGNDLSYFGGPVQTGAQEYNILVNATTETPWGGKIGKFQTDLFSSTMFGIINQYNAAGTYTVRGDYPVSYNTLLPLLDSDIFNIIHAVITANHLPTGYGAEYHVFLQSGVRQCSTSAGGCYGVVYCAYHGSNDYSDIGHVLYSVEPYQNINGCQVTNQPSPNGVLADSTASVLSHEMFETITDPDVAANNLAWYNNNKGEIGDICAPANNIPTGNVTLGSDTWEIQPEYSNHVHDCSYTP